MFICKLISLKSFELFSFSIVFMMMFGIFSSVIGDTGSNKACRNQIQPLLQGYEWKLNPEKFQNIGDDVDLVLMDIISDTEPIPNYLKMRAIEALKLYPNERVAKFLEEFLNQDQHVSLIRRGFNTFTMSYRKQYPEKIYQIATRLINHENAHLRLIVAENLHKLDTDDSKKSTATISGKRTGKMGKTKIT